MRWGGRWGSPVLPFGAVHGDALANEFLPVAPTVESAVEHRVVIRILQVVDCGNQPQHFSVSGGSLAPHPAHPGDQGDPGVQDGAMQST